MAAAQQPSPERQKLATAIADLRAAEKESATLDAAYLPSLRAIMPAEDAVEKAKAAIDAALHDAADRRVAAFAGGRVVADAGLSPERARQGLRAAEDDLAAVRAAHSRIDQRRRVIGDELREHRDRVAAAARAALWREGLPVVRALADDVRSMQRELAAKRSALRFLTNVAPGPPDEEVKALMGLLMGSGSTPWDRNEASKMEQAWRDSLEALQRDASATLPLAKSRA